MEGMKVSNPIKVYSKRKGLEDEMNCEPEALKAFDKRTHIEKSIDILQEYQPEGEYHLAFSGGIDSQVLLALADDAKVRYKAYYQNDLAPPEVKQFIRSDYPQVIWQSAPDFNFYKKMSTIGFPIRSARWCCEYMKEHGGNGGVVLVGVRREESSKRSKYPIAEPFIKKDISSFIVRPLLHWTRSEEIRYLKSKGIRSCGLYQEGFHRLGCVLCPNASVAEKHLQIARWPKMALAWEHSFDRLYANRSASGSESIKRWKSSKEMFEWYINETKKIPDDQLRMMLEVGKLSESI